MTLRRSLAALQKNCHNVFVQTVFAIGLLVGCLFAVRHGCPLLLRSALVLAANFIACNLSVIAADDVAPVAWFMFFDVASAIVLLWQPTGRTPAILARVYFVQLGLHYAHWASGSVDTWGYLTMLTVGGGLQIAFLLLGAINGDGRKIRGRRDSGSNNGLAVAGIGPRLETGAE